MGRRGGKGEAKGRREDGREEGDREERDQGGGGPGKRGINERQRGGG